MGELIRGEPLKITDVAHRFRVHRRTVERWFRSGLKHFYLGSTPFTTLEAIEQFARLPVEQEAKSRPRMPAISSDSADHMVERWGMGSFV